MSMEVLKEAMMITGKILTFSQNPSYEMLISNAGYLFDFTKDKDVSIRQLIGPAATER